MKILKSFLLFLTVFALSSISLRVYAAPATLYVDPSGTIDDSCGPADKPCKKILFAYVHANNGDTIQVAPGTYNENLNFWPVKNITLIGSGTTGANKTVVNGGGTGRVLYVFKDDKPTVKNIVLTNGHPAVNDIGGGGGGIYNNGTLTLQDCVVTENSVAGEENGGGIYNNAESPNVGVLNIQNCTISQNSSESDGAGLFNNGGQVSITSSTFSENHATANNSYGGAIFSKNGTFNIASSTLANNSAAISGGAINRWGNAIFNLHDTLVANNEPMNCNDKLSSKGYYNLDSGKTCGFDPTKGDLVETDPKLADLADNGGPSPTQALPAGSPAIDKGDPNSCTDLQSQDIKYDQRGNAFNRKEDGDADGVARCDIGAFEYKVASAGTPGEGNVGGSSSSGNGNPKSAVPEGAAGGGNKGFMSGAGCSLMAGQIPTADFSWILMAGLLGLSRRLFRRF